MESSVVEIRGHHLYLLFYCRSRIRGHEKRINYMVKARAAQKRHGRRYAEDEGRILRKIFSNPQVKIKVVARTDDFCRECPQVKCRRDVSESEIDKKIVKAFGCKIDEAYPLNEIIRKGNALARAYRKALPLKRGRPRIKTVVGSKIDYYKG